MPEGDTIFRLARRLDRALKGKVITRFACAVAQTVETSLAGQSIAGVEAKGKYLIVRIGDGRCLVTHMRMNGVWQLYRPNERWRRPEHDARVVIEAGERGAGNSAVVAVCFSAPVVKLLRQGASEPMLERLGPDVLGDAFDVAEARQRLRGRPERAIGEALVEQDLLAGVGNIYKSEILFAERVNPWMTVGDLDDSVLDALLGTARRMMRRNLSPYQRMRTTAGGTMTGARFAVYHRAGLPCLVCGATIVMQRQGPSARSTYYCPACQRSSQRT